MIIINVRSTTRRFDGQAVDENMETPRSLFDKMGIDYSRTVNSLSGTILMPDDMDCTFAELGAAGVCTLSAIIKADSAAM